MDRRTPMVAGIAFAVLYAVALVLIPRLPGIDQPGYDIVAHVNEHSGDDAGASTAAGVRIPGAGGCYSGSPVSG